MNAKVKSNNFLILHGLPIIYLFTVVIGALIAFKLDYFLHGYRLYLYATFPVAIYYGAVTLNKL